MTKNEFLQVLECLVVCLESENEKQQNEENKNAAFEFEFEAEDLQL